MKQLLNMPHISFNLVVDKLKEAP